MKPVSFTPSLLVMGVLIHKEIPTEGVFELLQKEFGPLMETTSAVPFDFTSYYNSEMGGEPERLFLAFETLVNPAELSAIKRRTNAIEALFCQDGGRRVNLDPGIITEGALILATTKRGAHRVPLSGGIYAEVTLLYRSGRFNPFRYTYADYRSQSVRDLLVRWRRLYLNRLK